MKKIELLFVMLSVSPVIFSQTTVSGSPSANPSKASAAAVLPAERVITLGDSVVPLDGEWKFQPGDSPWVSGVPEWAQPDFDDSKWAAMDMVPKTGSRSLLLGTSGYVPGWTKRGYPKLSGYAWYRLRVKVSDPAQKVWLKMPDDFDDIYQVYVNGRYVGQFGGFSQNHVTLYYAEPVSFALPSPGPDGEMELALRFYMPAVSQFASPDVGGMHGPPALGLASTVQLLQASEKDSQLHQQFGTLLETLIFLLVAPLALWAWLYNRHERAWLWLFLVIALDIVDGFVVVLSAQTTLMAYGTARLWENVFGVLLQPLWVVFWWEWFGLRERRWIPRTVWLLATVGAITRVGSLSPILGLNFVPQSALHSFNLARVWIGVTIALLLVVILVEGFLRDRIEALLATLPILLYLFTQFSTYLLVTFDIPSIFFPFGLGISFPDVAYILLIMLIGALALRRFVRTQVREGVIRKAIAQDLEQARELQQKVLVPETVQSKYFTVEAEYRPAQTVGGDFFQTLTKPDGSLLVVIGDVSGKGVSAAMLVAVLVGAIRTRADESFDPASMLTMLNQRLIGRSSGHFATCLAAELIPDGAMRIANAGHLPPYLNGRETELEGSLPLGVVGEAEYPVQTVTLRPGDRLTFMTDGVVEATNRTKEGAKELFGFERTREISREGAAAIAARAQSFGQEDDITVVGVELVGAGVGA
jgi:hypothetical protein